MFRTARFNWSIHKGEYWITIVCWVEKGKFSLKWRMRKHSRIKFEFWLHLTQFVLETVAIDFSDFDWIKKFETHRACCHHFLPNISSVGFTGNCPNSWNTGCFIQPWSVRLILDIPERTVKQGTRWLEINEVLARINLGSRWSW